MLFHFACADDTSLTKDLQEATSKVDNAISLTNHAFMKSESRTPNDLLKLLRLPSSKAANDARKEEIAEYAVTMPSNARMSTVEAKALYSKFQTMLHVNKPLKKRCSYSSFRTADGSCNNFNNPYWGAAATPFNRLQSPIYENGFSTPVGWTDKNRLPSARLVSRELLSSQKIVNDKVYTHMLMQWGQFLDHDLDMTPAGLSRFVYGDSKSCKSTCVNQDSCFPIQIPTDDPRIHIHKCMEFVRSSGAYSNGQREQVNDITAYIDASNVYGSSKRVSEELRDLRSNKGLLKSNTTYFRKGLLPSAEKEEDPLAECQVSKCGERFPCFVAGDKRANEQLGLLSMHTLWMREHNRIAKSLGELNPGWNGERIYQETRKIVGAEMQHITFNKWLPKIIGTKAIERMRRYEKYDPNVDASVVNVFATAAFRFGHSIIHPILHRLNEFFLPIKHGNILLHEAFFAPSRLVKEGGIDPLLRGLFASPTKHNGDTTKPMNSELTERLFELSQSIALDLGALNIQRGRDHGLRGYNEWREYCKLPKAKTFDDLYGEIRQEVRAKLQKLYKSPDDIDLFAGGLVEEIVHGSRVGPVFQCIISEQFKRLRQGDRFWYENPGQFSKEQLEQLKKVCPLEA